MKSIVIFYNDNDSKYKNEKVFGGKSSVEITGDLFKTNKLPTVDGVFTIDGPLTLTELISKMNELCKNNNADFAIFSYNDLPFLDAELTKQIIEYQTEYKSEYTFADGFPYGFAPEAIDNGTLAILCEISKTTQIELGQKTVTRDAIYNLIKTDINSFEVETVLAPNDWRLYRFSFNCGKKDNFMQCKALFEKADNKLSADEKSKIASETAGCLKTVPGFYNIQIAQKTNFNSIYLPYKNDNSKQNGVMNYDDFAKLVDEIAKFSENAVISLSAWGEPLYNGDSLRMIEKVLSYDGLSVFIETDGLLVDETFVQKLKQIVENAKERTNGWQKVMIAVTLDSFTPETYAKIHEGAPSDGFNKAVDAVVKLSTVIPGCVYPQFVRMNQNEDELERFFRFWNEKTNPSGGNLIIQKYDDFAGLLPPCKPADLAPLDRLPCWHCRRDLTILYNGDSPRCRAYVTSSSVGNVFNQPLEKVWENTCDLLNEHITKKYNEKCEKCDEFYTYNF